MRSRPGAARTILLFYIISARPPKQPLFFCSHGLGWWMHLGAEVTELSTNKQHHLSIYCAACTCAGDSKSRPRLCFEKHVITNGGDHLRRTYLADQALRRAYLPEAFLRGRSPRTDSCTSVHTSAGAHRAPSQIKTISN